MKCGPFIIPCLYLGIPNWLLLPYACHIYTVTHWILMFSRLFIGCVASAFLLDVLVLMVQLYLIASYFKDRNGLRSQAGKL